MSQNIDDSPTVRLQKKLISEGDALLSQNLFGEAAELFSEALELDPSSRVVHHLYTRRGTCYMSVGKVDRALKDFDRACKLNPENSNVWYNCALALHRLGEVAAALDCSSKSISFNSENEDAKCLYRKCLEEQRSQQQQQQQQVRFQQQLQQQQQQVRFQQQQQLQQQQREQLERNLVVEELRRQGLWRDQPNLDTELDENEKASSREERKEEQRKQRSQILCRNFNNPGKECSRQSDCQFKHEGYYFVPKSGGGFHQIPIVNNSNKQNKQNQTKAEKQQQSSSAANATKNVSLSSLPKLMATSVSVYIDADNECRQADRACRLITGLVCKLESDRIVNKRGNVKFTAVGRHETFSNVALRKEFEKLNCEMIVSGEKNESADRLIEKKMLEESAAVCVLVSSDQDFTALVQKLASKNKHVVVVHSARAGSTHEKRLSCFADAAWRVDEVAN